MYRKRNHGLVLIIVYLVFFFFVANSFIEIGPIIPILIIIATNILIIILVYKKIASIRADVAPEDNRKAVRKSYYDQASDASTSAKPQKAIPAKRNEQVRFESNIAAPVKRERSIYCQYCGEPGKQGQTTCKSCGRKMRG